MKDEEGKSGRARRGIVIAGGTGGRKVASARFATGSVEMNRQILKLVMPDHIGQSEIYDAGMTLLHQGCFDPVLFILEWGAVEVIKDGVQLTVLNHPGSIFGDLSSLLEIPHTASVRVVERSSFRVIRQANVAFRSSPKLTLFIAQQLARRFISLDHQPPETRTLI